MENDRTHSATVVEIDYPRLIRGYWPNDHLCGWERDHFDRSMPSWDKDGEPIWRDAYLFSSVPEAQGFAERAQRFLEFLLVDWHKGFPYQIRISSADDRQHQITVMAAPISGKRRKQ